MDPNQWNREASGENSERSRGEKPTAEPDDYEDICRFLRERSEQHGKARNDIAAKVEPIEREISSLREGLKAKIKERKDFVLFGRRPIFKGYELTAEIEELGKKIKAKEHELMPLKEKLAEANERHANALQVLRNCENVRKS